MPQRLMLSLELELLSLGLQEVIAEGCPGLCYQHIWSSSSSRSQVVNTCSGGKCRLGAPHLKWDPRGCPSGLHSPNNYAFHLVLHLYYLLWSTGPPGEKAGGDYHAHFTEVCLKLEPTQLVRTPSSGHFSTTSTSPPSPHMGSTCDVGGGDQRD